jgi:hypothetical protein
MVHPSCGDTIAILRIGWLRPTIDAPGVFASVFTFNRCANARMLDTCRKLTPEQYAVEPVPGWSSVRATVSHIAVVNEGWLRGLATVQPPMSVPVRSSRSQGVIE